MTEKRADELHKGDVIDLRGDRWTVVKAKVRGKHVRLTIDGRRGSFTDEVKARTVYHVLDGEAGLVTSNLKSERAGRGGSSAKPPGPLYSSGGAQTRWAEPGESSVPWSDVLSKPDRVVVEQLGARLVGVEVEGGRLVVPPVDDSTLFGHLLTMHGRRYDGVTVQEAKAWAKAHSPAGPESMADVIDALTLKAAYALHEELHVNFAGLEHPHFHREKMPA